MSKRQHQTEKPGTLPARDMAALLAEIDALKLELEALRQESEQRNFVGHLAGLSLWEWDIGAARFRFDGECQPLYGFEHMQAGGPLDLLETVLHPDDYMPFRLALREYAQRDEGTFHMNVRIRSPKGEYLWLLVVGSVAERDADGAPTLVRGGTLNIDRAVRARQELKQTLSDLERHSEQMDVEVEKTRHQMEQTRLMSEAMFEGNPHINLLFNSAYKVLDCNPAAVKFFGFRSKNGLLNGFDELMDLSASLHEPGSLPPISFKNRLRMTARDGLGDFEIELWARGKPTPVSVMLRRIPYEDSFAIVAYAVDLSSLREARRKIGHQDYLLRTVNKTATRLLGAQPGGFDPAVLDCLHILGGSVQANRVQVWENFTQNAELHCRLLYSWTPGPAAPGSSELICTRYAEVPFWSEALCGGKSVNSLVRNLPPEERRVLEPAGVLTSLVIPIFSQGAFWGFISFEDTRAERLFTKQEESILKPTGLMIASAIMRNQTTANLLEATQGLQVRDKLLQAVAETATLLYAQGTPDFTQTLWQALKTLGESVDTDRAYIWQNSLVDGRLCASPLAEWARSTPSAVGGLPDGEPVFLPYDDFFPAWRDMLAGQGNLNTLAQDMNEALAGFAGMHDVLSCLIIPIVLQGEFWGLIGFDDIERARVYTKTQEDILASGGMLIGAAVLRNDMTRNLIGAREEALASATAKSDFLSRMSHEIRTPMNAIIGMTTIARKTQEMAKIQQCLDKVDVSSRQLLGIINDVLDMSKIDANKLDILSEEFDFEHMMQNVFNVVQVRLDEKHQDFHFDFEGAFTRKVISDELRLSQVLINLLTNAVKFTPEAGRIALTVRMQELGDDRAMLRMEVADDGIGISAENQIHLFQSFEQADGSITRQFGGTGLGLAISKRIIGLMGGEIWVESEEGQGSVFIFEVPVAWGAPCAASGAGGALSGGLRILVVDDAGDVLEYFSNILSGFSVRCDTADSGSAAIAMAQQALAEGQPYNIAFIDWNMPGLNGGKTAREIKRIMDDNIVAVMISVAEWNEIEKEAKSYGVTNFLPKPVLPSALYDTLVELTDQNLVTPGSDPASAVRNWGGKQILLVEDIEINREIVINILEETGVDIECAVNGAEAVEMFAAKGQGYDLILMDVQMPILDGLGATQKIRASGLPCAQSIPIIAMTANAFKEDEQSCLAAGMNSHVAKPLEVDTLFAVLSFYLDAGARV